MDHRPTRRHALALLGAALAAPWIARAASPVAGIGGRAFATTWRIALPDGARTGALRPAVATILAEIDREMSPWRHDGDAARFNRAPAGTHHLPAATLSVARDALALARRTGGAFDPTVGPRVAALGFGPIAGEATGWRTLRDAGDALEKTRDGATLDLCGIAKGHALDRLGKLLRDHGHAHALIEIGGELRALGHHPEGRPWRAGVEDPRPGHAGLAAATDLPPGTAVATSGTRWNGRGTGAGRVSHVVDARGPGVADARLLSVSVRAADGTMADGWATALLAAGPVDGPRLAQRHGVSALFLHAAAEGRRREVTGDAAWS